MASCGLWVSGAERPGSAGPGLACLGLRGGQTRFHTPPTHVVVHPSQARGRPTLTPEPGQALVLSSSSCSQTRVCRRLLPALGPSWGSQACAPAFARSA